MSVIYACYLRSTGNARLDSLLVEEQFRSTTYLISPCTPGGFSNRLNSQPLLRIDFPDIHVQGLSESFDSHLTWEWLKIITKLFHA
jgi:hypothetical protein